jgi:hypothetical protein
MKRATTTMKKNEERSGRKEKRETRPLALIDARNQEQREWRGRPRASPELSSSRPTPKWSRSGSGEGSGVGARRASHRLRLQAVVKMTFAKGASLETLQALQLQPRRQHRRAIISMRRQD